jgi:signal transduction histidine kinase
MNLLVNAAQSIASTGEVRIVTRTEDGFVVVQVSDTGCGIAPENLKKIFDPFFTTKPVGDGSGLGLSISYGIVERHGGTITAESTVGKGTTFTVRIPVEARFFDLSH